MMDVSAILQDAGARQRRAIDPEASVWVAASAGTGKTKVLTDRILALLLAGTAPQRLLCLTFTKAAAAEMSNRLALKLADWTVMDEGKLEREIAPLIDRPLAPQDITTARRLFAQVLDVPGGMHIETIHAFCQSLLRRFPLEAGLSPHFQVMAEPDAQELMAEAQDRVLAHAMDSGHKPLADALALITARVHETKFPELIAALAAKRGKLGHALAHWGGAGGVMTRIAQQLGLDPGDTVDRLANRACDEARFDAPGLLYACPVLLASKLASDQALGRAIAAWLEDPGRRVADLDDYLGAFLTQKGEIRKKLGGVDLRRTHPRVGDILDGEAERLVMVRNALNAADILARTGALLELGAALLACYQDLKEGHAKLDYQDLIDRAAALLSEPGISPWILYKLDGGIDHVLVDEAQDTSPEQWAILQALTEEFFSGQSARCALRTLFVVGDSKQSIYSFQGADPDAFHRSKDYFEARVTDAGRRWQPVDLQISFRSAPAVIDAVNAVFAPASPARDGVGTAVEDIDHLAARQGQLGRIEIWPPVTPEPADPLPSWKPPVDRLRGQSPSRRLAVQLAERIARMIGHETLASRGRAVLAGDILVLVRRRNSFVVDLIRELKARRVSVAGADRMVLNAQIAVMDLVGLGVALTTPSDDLTLAAVLKSPLIGLTEEQLFTLAAPRTGRLWEALAKGAETDTAFAAAMARLARWRSLAERTKPFEFYSIVLGADGARSRFEARLGAEAEDPIEEFLTLALAFERTHPPSLPGFLTWFERAGVSVKRDLDQGTVDAVRIMTVHGSKGLQAPIVIMPDTLQAPDRGDDPLLWLDDDQDNDPALPIWPPKVDHMDRVALAARDRQHDARQREYHRLLYVAMTRAEDRLIVCGYQGRRASTGNWYLAVRAQMQPLCGPADDDGILIYQTEQIADPDRPDPGPGDADRRGGGPLPPWMRSPPPPEPKPPTPLAPSRLGADEPAAQSPLAQDQTLYRAERGLIIHRLFQTLPDIARTERSQAALRYVRHAAPSLDAGQMLALISEVTSILDDSRFAPFFDGDSLAEVPISGIIGTHAIAGVLDRLVVRDGEVLALDFKTNRRPPANVAEVPMAYLQQMSAYHKALACIYPGRHIRAALLWTDTPALMELPARLLDDVDLL